MIRFIPWYIPLIVSSFVFGFFNLWIKNLELYSLSSWVKVTIPYLIILYGFWYGYCYTNSFIFCFILAVASTSLASVIVSYYILGDQLCLGTAIGGGMVIVGSILIASSLKG